MPIYAYRCENCGVQFERQQSFSDDPLLDCPECEEPALRKLIQPVGVVFKGSGFYVTDNRSSNGGRASTTSTGSSEGDKSEQKEANSSDRDSKPSASKSSSSSSDD